MDEKAGLIDYQEVPSVKVGMFLLSEGFILASTDGFAEDILCESDALGILYNDPDAKPRKYLFGLITRKPRRKWIGVIRFTKEKHWVFDVHGRQYTELIKQLAKEMATTFNTKIILRLVREQPKTESYTRELYGGYDYA